jgi:hypothetical protein
MAILGLSRQLMKCFETITFAALLIASVRAVEAAPGDYIHLSAGGTMTSGLDISIDLDTGTITRKSMSRGSLAPGERPNWLESKKQLTQVELKDLIDTIRSSLNEGLKSRECIEREDAARQSGKRLPIRMPTMDSITFLYVHLDGQFVNTPDQECRTRAFDRVWKATYDTASLNTGSR